MISIARYFFASLMIAALPATPLTAQDSAGDQQGGEDPIKSLIENLDAPTFKERREATDALWRMGEKAEAMLQAANKHESPEVRFRASQLLEKFRYGIYPGTPPDILKLIEQFRDGNFKLKVEAINKLSELGKLELTLKLVATVSEATERKKLTTEITNNLDAKVKKFIQEGNLARAATLLELGADVSATRRNCAVFHHLNGSLDAAIARLRLSGDSKATKLLLVWMYRVQGNFKEALKLAREADDEISIQEITVLTGRTKAYCAEYFANDDPDDIEDLGFKLAYQQLDGDLEGAEKSVAQIKAWAGDGVDRLWYLMEALVLNGKADEAINVIKDRNPGFAAELLMQQGRWIEALEVLGIKKQKPPFDPWLESFCEELKKEKEITAMRVAPAVRAGALCVRLGEMREAERILTKVAHVLADLKPELIANLVFEERRLDGLEDLTYEHARLGIRKTNTHKAIVGYLYPGVADVARGWYEHLRGVFPDDDERTTLERLEAILLPRRALEIKPAATEIMAQAEEAFERGAFNDLQVLLHHEMLFTAFRAHSQDDKALKQLQIIAELQLAEGVGHRRLGEHLAAEEKWDAAAAEFAKASELAPKSVPLIYLQAHALAKAGKSDEAAKLDQLARISPLGDPETRLELAEAMWDLGEYEKSVAECRLIMRTCSFFQREYTRASQLIGDYLRSQKQWADAAYHLEISVFRSLSTNSSYRSSRSYFDLPRIIYELKTRAAIESGDLDLAVAYAKRCQNTMPADSLPLEEIASLLDDAGRQADVDLLFAAVYRHATEKTERFPKSAQAHNNLAWLCSRARRKLDEALIHAETAVDLKPKSAAYIDTLAEVHFALGDRARAIDYSEQAVKLAPRDRLLRQQLERFKSAPLPDSEPPPPPPVLLD